VGEGAIAFEPDGAVRAGGVLAGKLKIVDFGDYVGLRREEAGRFRAEGGSTPVDAPATSRVRGGTLESSNVQLPERMVQLTEVSRAFEALQRGITTLMNDVDGRAISELGRR
jgi:flagellar basal-body rod protein FlgF